MYYIYILKNPITGIPFYIGVGKRNRKSNELRETSHITEALRFRSGKLSKGSNRHKLNTILQIIDSNLEVDIELGKEFISEDHAFEEEKRLIALYGRRDLDTGCLTNMTNGGEGRVNPSIESRQKLAESMKGRPSHAKGKILGKYSEERKQQQKEKMKTTRENLTNEEKQIRKTNRSNAQKGKTAWNKGKTKETCDIVAKYAAEKIGKTRPDMVGHTPWNKGKTKDTDPRIAAMAGIAKGRPSSNKGIPSGKRGLTYEEIYGEEIAKIMKAVRSNTAWINDRITNKKINLSELSSYLEAGWIKGRIMSKRN